MANKVWALVGPLWRIGWLWWVAALSACGTDFEYQQQFDVPNRTWHQDQVVRFELPIHDTAARYNLYLRVANTNYYPFSNLWVFASTASPAKELRIDTVEVFLADETGKWLGRRSGELWQGYFPFKTQLRFHQAGIYQVQLQQGMRVQNLQEINQIGIALERIE